MSHGVFGMCLSVCDLQILVDAVAGKNRTCWTFGSRFIE